jgi:hypothetical protein
MIDFRTGLPHASLKITIPPDNISAPAVENGALLSASELQARGQFVYSPSDEIPEPVLVKEVDDAKDKTYRPPKHVDELDEEAPEAIYTSEGGEITSETEYGHELVSIQRTLEMVVY